MWCLFAELYGIFEVHDKLIIIMDNIVKIWTNMLNFETGSYKYKYDD